MKTFIINLLRILSKLIKTDKKLITLLYRGYSGSNLSPIIEQLQHIRFNNYKIKVLRVGNDKVASANKLDKLLTIKDKYYKYKYVFRSNLVITTHGFYRLRNDNKMINLWHGIPLKSMGLMHKIGSDEVGIVKDDYFLSTSEFYNTIMNACIGIRVEKYFIAGYPRNDYLFNQNGLKNLETLVGRNINKKIILFMPTYRDTEIELFKERENNIFGFNNFDFREFSAFLEKNNLLFILKLHPNEEEIFINTYSKFIDDNIILIKSEDLEKHKMDFYKIVNAASLLITDYSSVYFDYLLLDRPIIFIPVDFEIYKKSRGFLLEPYDFWTPGPKCLEQESLQEEIIKCLSIKNYYRKERGAVRNIVHKYQDGNSTKRVIDLISKILED